MLLKHKIYLLTLLIILAVTGIHFISYQSEEEALTIYSGRSENLIGPVFEQFSREKEIPIQVRYGGTAELAATILEEGQNSPADIFFAQDAGALGALVQHDRLLKLDKTHTEDVDLRFQSPDDLWIGISGRARVIAFNTNMVEQDDLPNSIWGFTDPQWKGRLGWAPTNGSFQAFISAFRVLEGEEKAREWVEGILNNDPRTYKNNTTIVEAVGRGEIEAGFVNHYYLFRFLAEKGEDFPVRNHHTTADAGSMINIAGTGILDVTDNREKAENFLNYLLSSEIQNYFVQNNKEYPVTPDIEVDSPHLLPLSKIKTPEIDLTYLEDLEGTLELLRETGAL